jgi:hypothetical protein
MLPFTRATIQHLNLRAAYLVPVSVGTNPATIKAKVWTTSLRSPASVGLTYPTKTPQNQAPTPIRTMVPITAAIVAFLCKVAKLQTAHHIEAPNARASLCYVGHVAS